MVSDNVPVILLVEDSPAEALITQEYLTRDGHAVELAMTGAEAMQCLRRATPDVVVLDIRLPDMDGLDILARLHEDRPAVSVVVVTSQGSVNLAVEAMRRGAFDFIVKPFNADRLTVTVRNALERHRLTGMLERYRRNLDRDRFFDFIGDSAEMQAVYRTIESVASSKASVFITGESGTGKELAAEAVHRASPRRDNRFVALNCAAIPRELLESELFGHVRGAFTGAVSDRTGAAVEADGGTLFLDEICEMAGDLQAKMLRFIQTGAIQPVGSTKSRRLNVRFVCATNKDPLTEVEAGRFREDLYYRLHVVPLHLPALRDRDEDALLIAQALLSDFSREEGKRFQGFAPAVEACLRRYDWPGNVRQLQNVVRNVVILNDGDLVETHMLPEPLRSFVTTGMDTGTVGLAGLPGPRRGSMRAAIPAPANTSSPGVRPLWAVEKETILHALRECNDDVPRAATLLEISPSTIYRKLQAWRAAGVDPRKVG